MTVSIKKVEGFQSLPKDEAFKVIYEVLLPKCERNGIYLFPEGNIQNEERYRKAKEESRLLNIE